MSVSSKDILISYHAKMFHPAQVLRSLHKLQMKFWQDKTSFERLCHKYWESCLFSLLVYQNSFLYFLVGEKMKEKEEKCEI